MENLGQKVILLLIALVFFSVLFGYTYAVNRFNVEIPGIQLKILMNTCEKNEGVKTIRRELIDYNHFIVQCNNSAKFEGISFNLSEETK